jgi:hypothetical protein
MGGLYINVSRDQDETQIEKALTELNINLILANSPQAKKRIERLFNTFQDRLLKELRLKGVKNYQEANIYLKKQFISYYNKRFAHKKSLESVYKKLPVNINLDLTFPKKCERKVNFDNTIKFMGDIIQIPPSKYRFSFAKFVVDVFLLEDKRIYVLYKKDKDTIHKTKLSKNNKDFKISKQIESFLNHREYSQISV